MRVYNVEVFDKSFQFKSHTNLSAIDYSEDYFSPETNTIVTEKIDVGIGDFVSISDGDYKFFGIVSAVTDEDPATITISYKSFLTLFDLPVLFDTNLQGKNGTTSLELYIANTIQENFVSNTDKSMNLPSIICEVGSETSKWTLGLESDEDDSHYCIVDFLKRIIISAFERYSIRIQVDPDIGKRTIRLMIGINKTSPVIIESDFPNITKKNIMVNKGDKFVNKVIVYNSENYTDKLIFYRHPDNTFNTKDENRIVPVVQEIYATEPLYEEGEIIESFVERAIGKAEEAFSVVEYDNLIELTMAVDDPLVKPMTYEIGQVVNVISGDKQYTSILSGKTISNTITLIFGTIRVDLTKQIWRSSYGY